MASGPAASSPKGFQVFARGADDAHVGPSMHGAVPAPNAGARTAGHISSPMAHPHIDSSLHATNPEAKRQGFNLYTTANAANPPKVIGSVADQNKVYHREQAYAHAEANRELNQAYQQKVARQEQAATSERAREQKIGKK